MTHRDRSADQEGDGGDDVPDRSLWLVAAAGLESALSTAVLFGPLERVCGNAVLIVGLVVLPVTSITIVVLLAAAEIGLRKGAVLGFALWGLATAVVQLVVFVRLALLYAG